MGALVDRPTSVQYTQMGQILDSQYFTPEERRAWMLDLSGMTRFEAREAIANAAAEYKARKREKAA